MYTKEKIRIDANICAVRTEALFEDGMRKAEIERRIHAHSKEADPAPAALRLSNHLSIVKWILGTRLASVHNGGLCNDVSIGL